MKTDFREQVYALVRSIPSGHVSTYGALALALGNRGLARAVGNALHRNDDPFFTPCWRIVNSEGHLAANFGIGGAEMQRAFLEADGIKVSPDGYVDLSIYGYTFP